MESRQIRFLKTIAEDFLSVFANEQGQLKYLTSSDYSQLYDEDNEKRFECKNGASKVVLVPKDEHIPFVVKIPFCGGYHGSLFEQKNGRGWDYCRTEVEIYQEAKKEHLEYLFAETSFLGEFCGYPVYIQERAKTGLSYYPSRSSLNYVSKKKAISNDISRMGVSNYLVATIVDYYGHSVACSFIRFCKEHDLNDFHGGNYAFARTDAPIHMKSTGDFFNNRMKVSIIDYSGFSGQSKYHDSKNWCKNVAGSRHQVSSSDSDSSCSSERETSMPFEDVINNDYDAGDFAAVELNKPARGLHRRLMQFASACKRFKKVEMQVGRYEMNPP